MPRMEGMNLTAWIRRILQRPEPEMLPGVTRTVMPDGTIITEARGGAGGKAGQRSGDGEPGAGSDRWPGGLGGKGGAPGCDGSPGEGSAQTIPAEVVEAQRRWDGGNGGPGPLEQWATWTNMHPNGRSGSA